MDKKEALKIFKERHGQVKKELLERVKYNNRIIAAIKKSLKGGSKTVLEIAKETGIDTYEVFWFINALRKYGNVEVEKKEGNYDK